MPRRRGGGAGGTRRARARAGGAGGRPSEPASSRMRSRMRSKWSGACAGTGDSRSSRPRSSSQLLSGALRRPRGLHEVCSLTKAGSQSRPRSRALAAARREETVPSGTPTTSAAVR